MSINKVTIKSTNEVLETEITLGIIGIFLLESILEFKAFVFDISVLKNVAELFCPLI